MRDPRFGLAWSGQRVAIRRKYGTYMASPAWFARRHRWVREWTEASGYPPACLICGGEWTEHQGDLHHRSYKRLGHEQSADLIALCRSCHDQLHHLLDANPAWRYRPRSEATDHIVRVLRRQQQRKRNVP